MQQQHYYTKPSMRTTAVLDLSTLQNPPLFCVTRLFAVDEHVRAGVEGQAASGVLLTLVLAHQVRGVVTVLGKDAHGPIHSPVLQRSSAMVLEVVVVVVGVVVVIVVVLGQPAIEVRGSRSRVL